MSRTVILDTTAVGRAISRIAHEIIERNEGAEQLALVGIKRRGEFLATRIAQKIEDFEGVRPLVEAIDITAFRDDKEQNGSAAMTPLALDPAGKTIVLVDDVLFTGRSARAAMEAILQKGRAQAIQLAVLIDRGHRELPIRPDFVGKNLPTNRAETVIVSLSEIDNADGVMITK